MKAFVSSVLAAIVIAVVVGVAMNYLGLSTAETFSTSSVRL